MLVMISNNLFFISILGYLLNICISFFYKKNRSIKTMLLIKSILYSSVIFNFLSCVFVWINKDYSNILYFTHYSLLFYLLICLWSFGNIFDNDKKIIISNILGIIYLSSGYLMFRYNNIYLNMNMLDYNIISFISCIFIFFLIVFTLYKLYVNLHKCSKIHMKSIKKEL